MTDLEDTFGESFAENVQDRIQERRAEREKISDETKAAIAHLAINEEAFKDGDPMFEYTADSGITHNVLLMQLAQPREGSVWNMAKQLDSGAVSVPLDYLGEWVWSIFNDTEMAKKLEEDTWYIVVGNLDDWEDDQGRTHDQFSPVRGVMTLEQAKQLAEQGMADEGFDEAAVPDEEESQEPQESESEDEGQDEEESSESIFSGEEDSDEEEEEDYIADVTFGEVANVVEDLGDQEPEVWEVTPDHGEWETFMTVVMDRLGLDPSEQDDVDAVGDLVMKRVSEGPADDDDDEDGEENKLFG